MTVVLVHTFSNSKCTYKENDCSVLRSKNGKEHCVFSGSNPSECDSAAVWGARKRDDRKNETFAGVEFPIANAPDWILRRRGVFLCGARRNTSALTMEIIRFCEPARARRQVAAARSGAAANEPAVENYYRFLVLISALVLPRRALNNRILRSIDHLRSGRANAFPVFYAPS